MLDLTEPQRLLQKSDRERCTVRRSLSANANLVKKARFKIGETVRIRLKIPTFHKSYKTLFTEEIFEIVANPTLNH